MKKIHVDCSFPSLIDDNQFINEFDIISPIDIPAINSIETLWNWVNYWKVDLQKHTFACFYNLKNNGHAEYKTYVMVKPEYILTRDGKQVLSFLTPENIKRINDTIIEGYSTSLLHGKIIIIPRSGTYSSEMNFINDKKSIDISFHEMEQKIIDTIC